MKKESHLKYINIVIYTLTVIILGTLAVMLLFALRDFIADKKHSAVLAILTPFIYGLVLAYLLNPLMKLFERKVFFKIQEHHFKLRRNLSIWASFIIAAVVITLMALMVVPQIGDSLNQLTHKIIVLFSPAENAAGNTVNLEAVAQEANLDALLEEITVKENASTYDTLMNTNLGVYISGASASVQHFISRFGFNVDIEQSVRELILAATAELMVFFTNYYQAIINATASFVVTTAKQLFNIIMSIFIAFYVLTEKEALSSQVKKLLYALLPAAAVRKLLSILHITQHTFQSFITGKLLDSLIIGVICFICMSLFGINYTVLISVIVGVTNIIPFFGPFIGAIPSFLFLIINDFNQGIWFLVFIIILQQLDGNFIGPKILGSAIGISSFWVIFSILVFSGLVGPLGMFIGVPLFAVLYTFIKDFSNARLIKKGLRLPPDTVEEPPPDEPASESETSPVADVSAGRRFSRIVENLSKNIQAMMNKTNKDDEEL